ncbi:hypothetical protein AB0F81_15195 [Actinoplanes sp. NPDC024001]|uniref:hypothetical protein n=1 Tax=Actinoplanes sp. NPDC024001 TaxID=3154598 RepID=UPI0033F1ED71
MIDSGGTNWWALRVPEMWSMIEPHDGAAHQHLVGAWKRSYELVLQHIAGVERYRESLAAAWPPERSAAAQAYMQRLDALIASLRETYDAAVENHRALAGAAGALDSARKTMETLQREHAANEVMLAEHQEEMKAYHLVGGKAKGVPPQSPVAPNRQSQLEDEARRVMSSLSSELALAQISIIEPKLYKSPRAVEPGGEPFPLEGIGLPLPSATPTLTRRRDNALTSTRLTNHEELRSRPVPPRPPMLDPREMPSGDGGQSPRPSPQAPGPVLGESQTTPKAVQPDFDSPTPPKSPVATTPHLGVMPTPTRPSEPIGSRQSGKIGPVNPPSTSGPFSRTTPHGGIIGGLPSSGAGQPGPGRVSTQRVNPVGGLIGQGTAPNNRPLGSGQIRGIQSRRKDPDNPWKTNQGIPPVLRPDPPEDFDPGPAIGLPKK